MKSKAVAGSLISCDLLVEIESDELLSQHEIIIESVSILQYGKKMKKIIEEEIRKNDLKNHLRVKVVDKGAMDYVLRARMQTALNRIKNITSAGESHE